MKRRYCLRALLLLLLSTHCSPAAFAQEGLVSSGWDRWGRRSPAPKIVVVMSEDEALCAAVATAFNKAGTKPGALYKSSLFLKWHLADNFLGAEQQKSSFRKTLYLVVDVFNIGRDVVIAKHAPASGNLSEFVVEYFDVNAFRARKFENEMSLMWDALAERNIGSFTTWRDASKKYDPFHKLPNDFPQTKTWLADRFLSAKEINLIRHKDTHYVVARQPDNELSVVFKFSDPRTADEVCYLGPAVLLRSPDRKR